MKIELDDEICEYLQKIGQGDANFGILVVWELMMVYEEIVEKTGLLSLASVETARRLKLKGIKEVITDE